MKNFTRKKYASGSTRRRVADIMAGRGRYSKRNQKLREVQS
jgi:hypothetical protein